MIFAESTARLRDSGRITLTNPHKIVSISMKLLQPISWGYLFVNPTSLPLHSMTEKQGNVLVVTDAAAPIILSE